MERKERKRELLLIVVVVVEVIVVGVVMVVGRERGSAYSQCGLGRVNRGFDVSWADDHMRRTRLRSREGAVPGNKNASGNRDMDKGRSRIADLLRLVEYI